jgi:hypothetical protein
MSSFLSAIRPHIERKIGLTFGNGNMAASLQGKLLTHILEILQNAQYEVCITVPPWWTHSQRTGYALHLKRVYPRLRLVCEATACLNYHISKNKRHKFEPQASYAHCSVEEEITVRPDHHKYKQFSTQS